MAIQFPGRVEAKITIPTSTSVSATNSGGGPTAVTATAGSYYLTAAAGVNGLLATFQSVLNSTRPTTDTTAPWSVTIATGAGSTGVVTIDCTSGDRLVRSAATAWSAGATASTLLTGDGYVQFTATATGKYRVLGLSASGTASVNYNTIAHGIYLKGGGTPTDFAVVETGTEQVTGTYASGDVFKVVRTGTVITYYQNGTLLYTSAIAAAGNRVVDSAFFDASCSLDGIRYYVGGALTALTWVTTLVTKTATTWSLAWTSTTLRDLLGFTADISAVNVPRVGTKQARGLWLPDCPLTIGENSTTHAPLMTDQRITVGPTGTTFGMVGNSHYEQASLRWALVPKAQVWESNATTANASFEFFVKDTQYGLGLSCFSVCSPVQIYDYAGDRLGSDASITGWTMLGLDGIKPKRTDQRGYDGLWSIEIPNVVSSG